MLTWKRPQKHHHVKERIFPVLPVQKLSKSVHGAWRNLKFCSFFFFWPKKKKLELDSDHPFKGLVYCAAILANGIFSWSDIEAFPSQKWFVRCPRAG